MTSRHLLKINRRNTDIISVEVYFHILRAVYINSVTRYRVFDFAYVILIFGAFWLIIAVFFVVFTFFQCKTDARILGTNLNVFRQRLIAFRFQHNSVNAVGKFDFLTDINCFPVNVYGRFGRIYGKQNLSGHLTRNFQISDIQHDFFIALDCYVLHAACISIG